MAPRFSYHLLSLSPLELKLKLQTSLRKSSFCSLSSADAHGTEIVLQMTDKLQCEDSFLINEPLSSYEDTSGFECWSECQAGFITYMPMVPLTPAAAPRTVNVRLPRCDPDCNDMKAPNRYSDQSFIIILNPTMNFTVLSHLGAVISVSIYSEARLSYPLSSPLHLHPSALRTVLVAATTTMLDVTSANSTDAGGSETSTNLLNDRINLIAATTLLGVTYGIMTTLYCMTTYSLIKKLSRRNVRSVSHPNSLLRSQVEWRRNLFYLAYTTVLFILATLYTGCNSQNAIVAYVDHRLYPGGPYQYYIMFMASQSIMVMTDVTSLIILWMTDALILCRFILFYHKLPYARWIIPLPCAMYLGVIILSALVLQGEAQLGKIFYLSENMLLAYYALSFSLNVLSTVLIAVRLYWHKVRVERMFGQRTGSPYTSIATILIESAALYGAWSLLFLILCIQQSPGQTIVLATMSQVQVIAPLLIIFWIARGKAWNHGKTFGDEDEESHASGVVRLSFGSRPVRVAGEFGVDDVHPDMSRNASWSTVVGGSKAGQEDGDVNEIELGLCGSQPLTIIDDLKA